MVNAEEDCDAQPSAVVNRQAMQVSAQRRKATFFMVYMSKSSSKSKDVNEAMEDFLIVCLQGVAYCQRMRLYDLVLWTAFSDGKINKTDSIYGTHGHLVVVKANLLIDYGLIR